MLNYQTVIQATAKAKEECYHLATAAFNASQPDAQSALYNIADKIQAQLDRLVGMENKENKEANMSKNNQLTKL